MSYLHAWCRISEPSTVSPGKIQLDPNKLVDLVRRWGRSNQIVTFTRLWFQIFFMFTPKIGEMIQFD